VLSQVDGKQLTYDRLTSAYETYYKEMLP
jgi:hypothetical protein